MRPLTGFRIAKLPPPLSAKSTLTTLRPGTAKTRGCRITTNFPHTVPGVTKSTERHCRKPNGILWLVQIIERAMIRDGALKDIEKMAA